MALIFDRRQQLTGQPVTHAVVVGVSDYRFLPGDNQPPRPATLNLKRLASPALSAHTLAAWLVANADTLAKPLATCRLLASPSALEEPLLPALPDVAGTTGTPASPADWSSFVPQLKAWRADASLSPQDTTIFYYSGHGLQRLSVPIITLADFADEDAGGVLMRSVDLPNIVGGMGPSDAFPSIARSQFYFVDACREDIDAQALQTSIGSVFTFSSGVDDRGTPTFQGSYPGAVAQARAGRPTDFCEALIAGLEAGAEYRDLTDPERRWPINTFTLHNAIALWFLNSASGQYAPLGGVAKNETLRWLSTPPLVDLQLSIAPDAAVDVTTVTLNGPANHMQPANRVGHPYKVPVPAGHYNLVARDPHSGYLDFVDEATISQQNAAWYLRMEAAQ